MVDRPRSLEVEERAVGAVRVGAARRRGVPALRPLRPVGGGLRPRAKQAPGVLIKSKRLLLLRHRSETRLDLFHNLLRKNINVIDIGKS